MLSGQQLNSSSAYGRPQSGAQGIPKAFRPYQNRSYFWPHSIQYRSKYPYFYNYPQIYENYVYYRPYYTDTTGAVVHEGGCMETTAFQAASLYPGSPFYPLKACYNVPPYGKYPGYGFIGDFDPHKAKALEQAARSVGPLPGSNVSVADAAAIANRPFPGAGVAHGLIPTTKGNGQQATNGKDDNGWGAWLTYGVPISIGIIALILLIIVLIRKGGCK